jgi:hypothetical protein
MHRYIKFLADGGRSWSELTFFQLLTIQSRKKLGRNTDDAARTAEIRCVPPVTKIIHP